jgi:hypothetical protein
VFALYGSAGWQVGEVLLFSSQLGNGPARHTVVERLPLGQPVVGPAG